MEIASDFPKSSVYCPAIPTPERKKAARSICCEPSRGSSQVSLAPAETEVRAGAVLPGSGGPEHQATRALPQPTDNTHFGSQHLVEVRENNSTAARIAVKRHSDHGLFQQPRLITTIENVTRYWMITGFFRFIAGELETRSQSEYGPGQW